MNHIEAMRLPLTLAVVAMLAVLGFEQVAAQTRLPTVRPPLQSNDQTFRDLSRPKYTPNPHGDLSIRHDNGALRERLLGQTPIGGSLRSK